MYASLYLSLFMLATRASILLNIIKSVYWYAPTKAILLIQDFIHFSIEITFSNRHASHILSNAALLRVIVDLQCGSELCCDTKSGELHLVGAAITVTNCTKICPSQLLLRLQYDKTNPFYGSGHYLVFSGER